jgi:hypothetical protein
VFSRFSIRSIRLLPESQGKAAHTSHSFHLSFSFNSLEHRFLTKIFAFIYRLSPLFYLIVYFLKLFDESFIDSKFLSLINQFIIYASILFSQLHTIYLRKTLCKMCIAHLFLAYADKIIIFNSK